MLVGVLLLLVALVTADVTLVVSRIKPVVDHTNEALAAVRAGDYRLARSLSCSRDGLSSAAYAEFWRSLEQAKGGAITGYSVNMAQVRGDHARVDYDLTFSNDRTLQLTVDAYHERGRWRPCLP
ncbi:MAG: hypothetical protein U0V73_00875 [Acidimicrobiia bacterium]